MSFTFTPPKYAQVVAELRRRITGGTYPPGTLIPSEHQLVAEFGVSRPTIVKALTVLRQDGWIETRQGLGSIARSGRPFRRTDSEVAARFAELAGQWREATATESSLDRMVMHPAYQQIIGLGPQALPCILRDLARKPGRWAWALTAITGADPAAGCDTLEDAAAAWLEWGRGAGVAS